MENFRHYIQHYSLPEVIANSSYTKDKHKQKLFLSKTELLKGGFDWKTGKRFIENQEENIDFKEILIKYQEKIMKFNDWLKKIILSPINFGIFPEDSKIIGN